MLGKEMHVTACGGRNQRSSCCGGGRLSVLIVTLLVVGASFIAEVGNIPSKDSEKIGLGQTFRRTEMTQKNGKRLSPEKYY